MPCTLSGGVITSKKLINETQPAANTIPANKSRLIVQPPLPLAKINTKNIETKAPINAPPAIYDALTPISMETKAANDAPLDTPKT